MAEVSSTSVLLVDDDREALFALELLLQNHGYGTTTCTSGEEALVQLSTRAYDLAVIDVQMPGISGIDLTKKIKEDSELRYMPVVLLTASTDLNHIINGLDSGADTYIHKPYKSEELLARLHAVLRSRSVYSELRKQRTENQNLREIAHTHSSVDNIVGRSAKMRELYTMIDRIKDSPLPVLITGESGTGKELVARALHFNSLRKEKPFIAQNCATFSEDLLESELFGHVKGAFTGAIRDKMGLFEAADGGTLFLDEIGEMALTLQAKLLRVIQEGTFTPVGSTTSRRASVRVVTATHRDLSSMREQGSFREDLFYRINVISLRLPPLRERTEDIPLIIDHILERCAKRDGTPKKALSADALRCIVGDMWRGNVRELENELERAQLMAGPSVQIIEVSHLSERFHTSSITHTIPAPPKSPQSNSLLSSSLSEALAQYEREIILQALAQYEGNKSKVAEVLKISRTSLIKKVQEYEGSSS